MTLEWKISDKPVAYEDAVSFMEERVDLIKQGLQPECVWLLEHPAIYTAGTSANQNDLLSNALPVFKTGRGGEFTYHGPGQRVMYVMLDLEKRSQKDLRLFIQNLESWVIHTLEKLGIEAGRREGRVGLWVRDKACVGLDNKIAAIGVRVRKWITFHGVSINLNPDLSHFKGIVPCGIHQHGVTSLVNEQVHTSYEELDSLLRETFYDVFKEMSKVKNG